MQSQDHIGHAFEPEDNLTLRKARLFEGISKVVPAGIGELHPVGTLTDTQYTHVTGWCESNKVPEWGKRPRTLVILHMIGCPEAIDAFVNEGLSDVALPYSEENLPRVIKGPKRAAFIAHQYKALSQQAIELERPGGPHCNIDGSADVHFHIHRDLGSGGFGTVDHVFSRLSLQPYARKRVPRGRSFKKDRDAIRMFENELKTLKALSHRHLVRLISSYTDRKFVGLIMTPVADMDLHNYMMASRFEIPDQSIRLRRFFGCLATAVEYLHLQKIRHKDIKPQNILVKTGKVLLADFGTSRSWADDSQGTTIGTNTQAFTKAYCAPEVAMHETRNTSADIWSLGCVFLEMCTVLNGKKVSEMRAFFAQNGTRGTYIRDNQEGTELWMNHLRGLSPDSDDHQILDLIPEMCNHLHANRPTAPEVVSLILDFEGQMYYDFCCDRDQDHTATGDPDIDTMIYSLPRMLEPPESNSKTTAGRESSSSFGTPPNLSTSVAPASPEPRIHSGFATEPLQHNSLPGENDNPPEVADKLRRVDIKHLVKNDPGQQTPIVQLPTGLDASDSVESPPIGGSQLPQGTGLTSIEPGHLQIPAPAGSIKRQRSLKISRLSQSQKEVIERRRKCQTAGTEVSPSPVSAVPQPKDQLSKGKSANPYEAMSIMGRLSQEETQQRSERQSPPPADMRLEHDEPLRRSKRTGDLPQHDDTGPPLPERHKDDPTSLDEPSSRLRLEQQVETTGPARIPPTSSGKIRSKSLTNQQNSLSTQPSKAIDCTQTPPIREHESTGIFPIDRTAAGGTEAKPDDRTQIEREFYYGSRTTPSGKPSFFDRFIKKIAGNAKDDPTHTSRAPPPGLFPPVADKLSQTSASAMKEYRYNANLGKFDRATMLHGDPESDRWSIEANFEPATTMSSNPWRNPSSSSR